MRRLVTFLMPVIFLLGGLINAGASDQNPDWAQVKAWEGPVSMVRHSIQESSVPLGSIGKRVAKTEINQTLRCTVRYVDPYAGDEPFISWAGGGFPVNVTIDDTKTATTYKGDKVDMIETVNEKGSGQAPTEEVDSSFGIDNENRTYGFTIAPAETITVLHSEKITNGDGVVIRQASDQTKAAHTAGVTVQNMPLPSSGMHLSGTTTLDDGTTVTWDLKPVQ